ncbi:MAG: hypothetical protein ACXV97_07090 [Chthoniobacterales bacterium]
MEETNEEAVNDKSGEEEESSEQTLQAKLRDLKPEKDPIGAGNPDAPNPASTR